MKRKHPIQEVHVDPRNTVRFVENEIVHFLLNNYKPTLNDLYIRFHKSNPEDYEQLMMLIGYSLSGFEELCSPLMGEEKPCKFATLASAMRKSRK